jgi:hypothetical protein
MTLLRRMAAAAATCGLLAGVAFAQNPPPRQQPKASAPPAGRAPAAPQQKQNHNAYRPTQYSYPASHYGTPGYENHPGYRSVLRRPPHYSSEYTYGFRNPGGVGRFAEYYPPGDQFQNGGRDPVAHAGFDQNLPVGSISEQAMATQVGTQRYSAMQQHMDNFSRPMGFGYGFGFF